MSISSEQLIRENRSLQEENAQLRKELSRLSEQMNWLRRQIFGRKSERFSDMPTHSQPLLDLDVDPPEESAEETVQVPSHARRKKRQKGKFTLELPETLERVERVVDVPEAERTLPDGTPMVRIGEDRSEKLAYRPGEYYVLVTVRPKYAAPGDPRLGVVQEPMPDTLIEGSKFDASFMAHLVEEKFAFHMPLYRIEEKLRGRGIRITRQVLSKLIKTCGERVLPLFRLMVRQTLGQGYIFTDDTPVKLQARGKCREARMWIYVGARPNAPPYHIFTFTQDRSHRHPMRFLDKFEGVLHADAFGAYEKIHADPKKPVRWAACWAHARRKFENARSGREALRSWVLRQMRCLFLYERVAWNRSADERLRIRYEKEKPIVATIFDRLRQEVADSQLLPKSKMAEAIGYMLVREKNFTFYLNDPNVRMENNTAERGLRKLTIGRKNWMFIGSPEAGDSMAALLSLVQTCRALDIKPVEYLQDLFNRLLSHPASRLEELLPDQWQSVGQSTAE